ncbi:MAG TPA: hypothetical protein PLY73_12045, partial [Candidatus Ozemobacteraceae bacterium]|nr:hypothetical protein [Candidatus Ozemobacteraceae bacterium]
MKPLKPAVFREGDLRPGGWAERESTSQLWRHLLDVGSRFPSLTIGWEARPGLADIVERLAEMLTHAGLNVFLATGPVPVAALSQALGQRMQPLGLYISEIPGGDFSALALTTHGGPVLETDVREGIIARVDRVGVMGTTDFLEPYVKRMGQLLDPMIENRVRLSSLSSPFDQLHKRMQPHAEFRPLFEYAETGPKAVISPDGQGVTVHDASGKPIPTRRLVETLGAYLTRLRGAAGTLVGPRGTAEIAAGISEFSEIEGDALDMSS